MIDRLSMLIWCLVVVQLGSNYSCRFGMNIMWFVIFSVCRRSEATGTAGGSTGKVPILI